MATHSASGQRFEQFPLSTGTAGNVRGACSAGSRLRWIFLAALIAFASLAVAQNAPQVTGVDPASGKVNDTITLSGTNLGKDSVSSVFLSDDKSDFKATIIDQSDAKISAKVPQVKAGDYNISVQVGDKLFIKPVKFKVEQ